MRAYAEHNKVGVYRKLRASDVLIKDYGKRGLPYLKGGILVRSTVQHPIISYGKNYKRFGKDFSLFVWTTEQDKELVIGRLDVIAKALNRAEIMQVIGKVESFSYVADLL